MLASVVIRLAYACTLRHRPRHALLTLPRVVGKRFRYVVEYTDNEAAEHCGNRMSSPNLILQEITTERQEYLEPRAAWR